MTQVTNITQILLILAATILKELYAHMQLLYPPSIVTQVIDITQMSLIGFKYS